MFVSSSWTNTLYLPITITFFPRNKSTNTISKEPMNPISISSCHCTLLNYHMCVMSSLLYSNSISLLISIHPDFSYITCHFEYLIIIQAIMKPPLLYYYQHLPLNIWAMSLPMRPFNFISSCDLLLSKDLSCP